MKKLILLFLPEDRCKDRFVPFLEKYGNEYELAYVTGTTATDEQYGEACAIIGNPPVDKLSLCDRLEWFAIDFAGTDRYIDTVRKMKGLKFTNASGAFGKTISEYMLSVCLSLYKHLNVYRDNQSRHIWKDAGSERSIFGKQVLVVGTGDIGSCFAGLMKKFDCNVVGINRRGRAVPVFDEIYTTDKLKENIGRADIIALCVPRNSTTDKLIDEEALSLVKKDAILVNVGRGNAVDTKALIKALNEDRLLGAALDVFEEEPLGDSSIWDVPNLIITPHISGKTYGHLEDTVNMVLDICVENLYRYVEGNELINLVDMETGYRKVN